MIVTKDRLALLRRVMHAVSSDPSASEIVVVDDASSDGTAQWLRNRLVDGPPVRVVQTAGIGPAAARQVGVEHARGDLVLLLDDDVLPRPGLVSRHVAVLRGERARIAVGYSPVRLPERRAGADVAQFAYARDYERRCARYESGSTPVAHNLWGGNVSLWREAALAVGLSSSAFGERRAFYEDRDFGLRAHRAGLHAVFDRTLAADHHHWRSADAALADARRRGASAVHLHRLHGDLIGPYDPQLLLAGLPRPLAAGVRATRRARVAGAAMTATRTAIDVSGRFGRWAAQDASFKLARRVYE
ncbi:MAG TPA: glycosyltransferase, partial [Thermoleophilaceae bacterium]